jgi:hypothetical protein
MNWDHWRACLLREYPFPRPDRDNPFFKAVSDDMMLHNFSLDEAIMRALTSIQHVFSEHVSMALDFSTVQDALVLCLHMTTAYGGGDHLAWHLVSTMTVVLKHAVTSYPTANVFLLSCMCIAFSPEKYADWYYGDLIRAVVVQTECFLELHDDVVCGVLGVAVGCRFLHFDDVFHGVLEKIMCRRPRAIALAMATCSDALRPVHELFLVRLVRMSQERQELADVQDIHIVQGMVARVTGSNCLLDQDLVDAGVLTWVDSMAFPTKALLLANLSATLPDCPAVVKVGRAVLAPTFGRILSRALRTGKCSQAPVGSKAAAVQFFETCLQTTGKASPCCP